jgi:hypothetical protein
MAGYLNATSQKMDEATGNVYCGLRIPNKEVMLIYRRIIATYLSTSSNDVWLVQCIANLTRGKVDDFEEKLTKIGHNIFSYHDTSNPEPEKFYHGLLLGLVLYCEHTHRTYSNREAGNGRYDIALLPINTTPDLHGIIFEIKSLPKESAKKELMAAAENGLKQIEEKKYQRMQEAVNVTKWLYIGVAFSGKEFKLMHKIVEGKPFKAAN